MKRWTVGTSFSGIGVPDYAAYLLGMDVCWQIEIEPFCQKVLKKHAPNYWPHAELFGDIRAVEGSQLRPVDIFIAGSPCTNISRAGNKAGLVEGAESRLWFDALRIVGDLRPRIVIVENVADITFRGGSRILGGLAALGYVGRAGVISAADLGAPHLRERWWCIATLGDADHQRRSEFHTAARELQLGQHAGQPSASGIFRSLQSGMQRGVDGSPSGLDGFKWPAGRGEPQHAWEPPRVTETAAANKNARLRALGNAWTLPNALAVMNAAKHLLETQSSLAVAV